MTKQKPQHDQKPEKKCKSYTVQGQGFITLCFDFSINTCHYESKFYVVRVIIPLFMLGSLNTAKLSPTFCVSKSILCHCIQRDVSELWQMLASSGGAHSSVICNTACLQSLCVVCLWLEKGFLSSDCSGKYPACQIPLFAFDLSSTDPDCSGGRSSSPQQKRTHLCTQPKAQLGLFDWVFEYERVNTAIAHGCVRPSGMIRLNRFRLCLSH